MDGYHCPHSQAPVSILTLTNVSSDVSTNALEPAIRKLYGWHWSPPSFYLSPSSTAPYSTVLYCTVPSHPRIPASRRTAHALRVSVLRYPQNICVIALHQPLPKRITLTCSHQVVYTIVYIIVYTNVYQYTIGGRGGGGGYDGARALHCQVRCRHRLVCVTSPPWGVFLYIIMRGGFSVIRGRPLNIRG